MIVTSLTAPRETQASDVLNNALRQEMTGLVGMVQTWLRRHRTRLDLSRMNDHLLKDIGLTRGQAADEILKPFWRA